MKIPAAQMQLPFPPAPGWVIEVNECGIFASTVGTDFWFEQILARPVGKQIRWLSMSPSGGVGQIPCEDREEAEFVRDYMTAHGIHAKHVKVKRVGGRCQS